MRFSSCLSLALAPLLASSVVAKAPTSPSASSLEERTLFNCCDNGGLWKRNDDALAKRTFCLVKRTFFNTCPSTCNPLTCPIPIGGLAICTNNACDVNCLWPFVKSGTTCTLGGCDPSKCPGVSNGSPVCTNNACDITCNSGFNKVNGQCVAVCDPSKCPTVANSQSICTSSGTCDITCNSGFNKVNGQCVAVCDPSKCPPCSNGTPICTSSGTCDMTCNSGYTKVNGQCTLKPPSCTPSKCPSVSNGTPVCTSGTCDFTCKSGYTKSNGKCVSSCATKSVAFYDNFQTTANGEAAVTVSSIDACAAYCLSRGCASFDFWNGNQCGIQIGGGGFDGFQYSPGTVHGVPGQCSDYTTTCPEKVAVKACYNEQECPAPLTRLRRSHRGFRAQQH
ncbi:BQ2448_3517 [Microbotryum intermedium]|uniref:BQ2448_3517 protein n=1 Tax=Microbotryum intermedium TaxID=269621 RepID=A0A238FC30_9BASI|nr:BQ2448_3517 [Microbotryum intermedium]